ncbi:MAG: glycosyltransferase family 4 protein [Ruminococcaceae bacterium]|nr:glycosyltransferase family 4 protein [Oscillospiraceae bacterium]
MNRPKIAFVVQRYGLEINGGAELHCRQLAELLTEYYDVTVLTTCAKNYNTWENEYPSGMEELNGVIVHRFPCICTRDGFPYPWDPNGMQSAYGYANDINWMMQQGPLSFELIHFLEYHREEYDVFLFFTYLYFTTYAGLQTVPEKSILIPTAHDEPAIYRNIFRSVFHLPKGIFYNTNEERRFVTELFHHSPLFEDIGGVGVRLPDDVSANRFREKYHISDPFLLYVGRMTEKKGCHILFDYFVKMKERVHPDLKLVLMGTGELLPPKRDDIISLGFVSDQDKFDGIAASNIMVIPSLYESLSMVLLEAMSLEVPVLVNGDCLVLKEHCRKSNGGVYFHSFEEFVQGTNYLFQHGKQLGENGKRYVNEQYCWNVILEKLCHMIEQVRELNHE